MVGVNNRNLGTFVTDIENSFRIAERLRQTVDGICAGSTNAKAPLLVSESGISNPDTVLKLRSAGFRGFLIGETFMAFNGCSNDVYDPNKVQTEPTKNPLGEDFSAPNGFNWSMINTVKLNVSVKDEFAGQYNYLIEVFTSNPLSNTSATPIAAGTANQNGNYAPTVEVPKTFKSLYIRQTDPNQRKTVFEYAIPTDGGEINCQLYFSETAAKAFSTRATVTHGQ